MNHRIRITKSWSSPPKALVALLGILCILGTGAVVRAATSGPDFSLAAQPTSQAMASGSSASYSISVTPSGGFSGSVAVSASGLPNQTTASWTVAGRTTSGSSATVSVPAGSTAPVTATLTVGGGQPKPGTYQLTVTGTSGALSNPIHASLTVNSQNAAITSTRLAAPSGASATAPIAASAISAALSGAAKNAGGTMTFIVFGPQASPPSDCSSGGTLVGSATVKSNGTYYPSSGFTPSVGGTYWWYASYGGDAGDMPSSSRCGSGMPSMAVQDFSLATSTSSQTALTGGTGDDSATYAITVAPLGGYAGTVALSVSGLPAGVSANPGFNPTSTSGPSASSSALVLDIAKTGVTAGTYPLTVQGRATINSTTVTRTIPVTLVVQNSVPVAITGNVPNPLFPGAAPEGFTVTLTNANGFPIKITGLGSVGIQTQSSLCASSWFQVKLPALPSGGMTLAANGSTTLPATATMLDVNSSQDACKGQKLTLTYTGTYTK